MPDFIKKVAEELRKAYAEARKQAASGDSRAMTRERPSPSQAPKICGFWACSQVIRSDHFLCYDHYLAYQEDSIDECPSCGQFKESQYELCLDCKNRTQARTAREGSTPYQTWREPSPAWEAGDAEASHFFTYILKLDDGQFYAGQTRDLRARLMEHRDGKVKTTLGKHPKLQWFVTLPSRKDAGRTEAELKKLIDRNPREVRKLIIAFRDLYGELEFD